MSTSPFAARCVKCSTSFTSAELEGVSACPKCHSKGLPMDPSMDVTIHINVHELRILGIWAEHYASRCDHDHLDDVAYEPLKETIHVICARVETQLKALDKWMPLTMSGEMKQLKDAFPDSDITLMRDGHEEIDL